LPALLALAGNEGVGRFYLSHLNYAGRGNVNRKHDAGHRLSRWAMNVLFECGWEHVRHGSDFDITTGNNDADGPYFLAWVSRRFPARAAHVRALLARWGGNASGVGVANIDN